MQTMQEMAVAAMQDLPGAVRRPEQRRLDFDQGRAISPTSGEAAMTDFCRKDGSVYSPDFAAVARNFGLARRTVDNPAEIGPAVAPRPRHARPGVVEVSVARDSRGR